tara:strand:+ start:371 stop:559 length:189 start_codon:yes stop_codon:yes gene_type:complete
MYAEKEQWFAFILIGTIVVVGINVFAAKRDHKLFKELDRIEQIEKQEEQAIYQQLTVIPYSE